MDNSLRILGTLGGQKREVANKLAHSLQQKYPSLEGEMYLGYPIYHDEYTNSKICVDIAVISKIGVFIINILEKPVTDYGEIQDNIYAKVESKFKKQPFLFKRKKLIFEFQTITYCEGQLSEQDDYLLAKSNDELMSIISQYANPEVFNDDDLYGKILSGIQEAYGILDHSLREGIKEGTKAYAINQMATLVEKYGNSQMEAILSDIDGIQRIRGMAGSGKTVVLARKAAELHSAHPDWDIVVTYSTRSLKGQLENLISRFYSNKNDGAKYNNNKLKIMHSWGSSYSHGVYYEICLSHGISPLSYTEAKSNYGGNNLFSQMCADLLKKIDSFKKMYDCILIDEAQDFDKSFFQLCSKVIGDEQRLVYAYDELQSLNEELMPNPELLFGHGIENDTPLKVCYRNQGPVIVTAHAMGMGLYRKEGLVQLPGSADVWSAIGYISDRPIQEGEEAILYRTKETSPDLLNVDKSEIIKFSKYKNITEMYDALFETISEDITTQQLTPKDIMIIDMDTLSYSSNYNKLIAYLNNVNADRAIEGINEYKFRIHTAGAASPEDFFRDHSIVYSSVRRAKGNESYMVYIINAQKSVNTLQRRTDRNALFTAITRSKGWVRVFGYGEDMQTLCDEFNKIQEQDFKLYFEHYPTKEEQETIFLNNQDVEGSEKRAIDRTKELINRLSQEGSMSKVQLMNYLFDTDTEELRQLLRESENE